jgi:GNAT superfamily N-acetyltransferase
VKDSAMIKMSSLNGGQSIAARSVASMEETMQAFAVRAACFVGELDMPYSTAFDGRDFGATHLLALMGDEPVGALRLRWFKSFAMPERLAVMKRFRGQGVGQLLLQHSYKLAQERGCNTVYCRAERGLVEYFTRQGWTSHEAPDRPLMQSGVALTRPVDLSQPPVLLDAKDANALWDLARPAGVQANIAG